MWIICTSILLYAEMGAEVMWSAAASGADIRGHPGGDLFAAARKIRQPESRMCTCANSIYVLYIVFVIIWLVSFAHEVFTHLHYWNHCHVRHVNIIHVADRAISLDVLWWAAGGARAIAETGGSTLRRTSMCTIQKHQSESIDVLQVPNVKNMHIASLNFTSITKLDALSSQHYVNNIHIVLGSAVVWRRILFKAERPSVVLLISVRRIRWICEYNSHIHLRR